MAPNNRKNGIYKQSMILEQFWWWNHAIWSQDGKDMNFLRLNKEKVRTIYLGKYFWNLQQ